MTVSIDKVADKIAALGVPGLVLVVAMALTGYAGAAALTTALAVLGGPMGMLGGITLLGVLALIAKALAEFGFEALFRAVLNRLRARGLSITQIEEVVAGYWFVSSVLRDKLRSYLRLWGGV
ncbi:MAG: hypothetical protein OXU77_11175 [Gammaproteobacteria bacterium]|nr:hypothetical protein [Gammaproteobacteria bacterium]